MRLPRLRKHRSLLNDLRHRVEYVAFRLFACILSVLTVRQTIRFAELIADALIWRPMRKPARYHVAAENLRASFGEDLTDDQIERTIRSMWIHLVRVFVEIVQLPRKMTLTNCREVI